MTLTQILFSFAGSHNCPKFYESLYSANLLALNDPKQRHPDSTFLKMKGKLSRALRVEGRQCYLSQRVCRLHKQSHKQKNENGTTR